MFCPGDSSSPFGGIPRNWKQLDVAGEVEGYKNVVPPSGGSLEIGNFSVSLPKEVVLCLVPPSGGFLEIGNRRSPRQRKSLYGEVPPSGGSLEIGNQEAEGRIIPTNTRSPFGGIPRNWKHPLS